MAVRPCAKAAGSRSTAFSLTTAYVNHRYIWRRTVYKFTLISHALCPYVQRAAIVLTEKGVPFERRDIDLDNKPEWFLAVSPHGKTPVLLVNDQAIFESAVICEFLDEVLEPRLHPEDPLLKAQHRAWMEFGSSILTSIWRFYTAETEAAMLAKIDEMQRQFAQIEKVLGQGPYFSGVNFSMVDAFFGPVFRYFDVFDEIWDFGIFARTPKVKAWRWQLAERASVRNAVRQDYAQQLVEYIRKRGSELAKQLDANPQPLGRSQRPEHLAQPKL